MNDSNELFDEEGLLASLDDDRELVDELLDLFIEDAPKQLSAYTTALQSGDMKTAERSVHTLKGAAANLCAHRVRELAAALERACREGDQEEAKRGIDGLNTVVHDTLAKMKSCRA